MSDTSILGSGLFDQRSLAEVYSRAYAKALELNKMFPDAFAEKAVVAFCKLLTEDRDELSITEQ